MKNNFSLKVLIFLAVLVLGVDLMPGMPELPNANVTHCPERDRCERRTTLIKSYQKNCECDPLCSVYGDCCIDAPGVSFQPMNNSTRFRCMQYDSTLIHGLYVIDKCDHNWQGSNDIRSRCEDLNDLGDLFMAIPATNTQQNITFRNRYCSQCNDAVDSELQSWLIFIYCFNLWEPKFTLDELSYESSENLWGVYREGVFYHCAVEFTPNEGHNRQCFHNLISTCPSTWRDEEVKRMCGSYMSHTLHGRQGYRNPHCAVCNGISIDSLWCWDPQWDYDETPKSFAMLLDVNQNDGDIVGVSAKSKPSCPSGEKYDRLFKRCRKPASCALPGTQMVNGECVIET